MGAQIHGQAATGRRSGQGAAPREGSAGTFGRDASRNTFHKLNATGDFGEPLGVSPWCLSFILFSARSNPGISTVIEQSFSAIARKRFLFRHQIDQYNSSSVVLLGFGVTRFSTFPTRL